jgi:hypothetical protein
VVVLVALGNHLTSQEQQFGMLVVEVVLVMQVMVVLVLAVMVVVVMGLDSRPQQQPTVRQILAAAAVAVEHLIPTKLVVLAVVGLLLSVTNFKIKRYITWHILQK